MSKNIVLSIVIPTLNRYETLLPLLRALCSFQYDNFEIIIQDNSSDNIIFSDFYEKYKSDSRIKYFYSNSKLSAIENCDLAISKANGMYISFIGDDDGMSEKIIECCEWMRENNIDSVFFNRAIYTWPGTNHFFKLNNKNNGKLIIDSITNSALCLNVKNEFSKIIKSGGQSMYNAPRVYHGIIKKECLDQLYKDLGTYFPGPVPDMSNCIALTKYVSTHFFIDLPLIITGQSSKSMSGLNANRKHQGEINSQKSLPKTTADKWSAKIPFYWSGPTIWAQSAIEASNHIGIDVLAQFNFAKLYAYCIAFTSESYYSRIFKVISNEKSVFKKTRVYILMMYYLLQISFIRFSILFSKIIRNKSLSDFSDIECVISHINLLTKDISFKKLKGFEVK
jgi:glycosyltransferase involved in cell wall biosynthesis